MASPCLQPVAAIDFTREDQWANWYWPVAWKEWPVYSAWSLDANCWRMAVIEHVLHCSKAFGFSNTDPSWHSSRSGTETVYCKSPYFVAVWMCQGPKTMRHLTLCTYGWGIISYSLCFVLKWRVQGCLEYSTHQNFLQNAQSVLSERCILRRK